MVSLSEPMVDLPPPVGSNLLRQEGYEYLWVLLTTGGGGGVDLMRD